jgi:ComF family protein
MTSLIINQLFPKICLACSQTSPDYLCNSCLLKMQKSLIPNHFFISGFGELIFGYSHYAGISGKIIRSLKYRKKTPGAIVIAKLLIPLIQNLIQPDLIIPVPISWQKQWTRGFNQCSLIAEEIQKITHISMNEDILKRRFSLTEKDQVKLSAIDRKNNLNKTFIARKINKYPTNVTVLLLDDVATTGKTIYACQKALREVFPYWIIKPLVFAHN